MGTYVWKERDAYFNGGFRCCRKGNNRLLFMSTLLYYGITLYFAQHCLELHSIFVIKIIFVLN